MSKRAGRFRTARRALRTGRTLTALIEEALRERLARRRTDRLAPVNLPVFGGRGLQPGVDLDDMSDLIDRMEQDRGAA